MLDALKKLRRKSDAESFHGDGAATITMSSSAAISHARKTSRTKSISKRLSIFSNNSSSGDLNSIMSANCEETTELARFKSLNYDKFNKEVLTYLKIQGLSAPKILQDHPHIRISTSSSGENIFLPSLIAYSEEEQLNLDTNSPINISAQQNSQRQQQDSGLRPIETVLQDESSQAGLSNDDSADSVSHTFAIIISLYKPTSISTIQTQLQTIVKVLWPKGLPSDRSIKSELFEIGQMNWELNLQNYNFYSAPHDDDSAIDDESINNFGSIELDELDTSKYLTEQKIPAKLYQLKTSDQVIRGGYHSFKKHNEDPFIIGNLSKSTGSISYPAGDYVFLLPLQFPPKIPESLVSEKSQVVYNLKTIVVHQGNKTYDLGETFINVIRGPPVSGITTADKPIFVNKVWSDALNYEISFPKKYVTIGSEIPIKLKFAPLSKDVSLKRIKINIVEKITYISKNQRYEYDEELHEEYDNTNLSKFNERKVNLVEIGTKSRISNAIKQELVKTNNDNLLSCIGAGEHEDGEAILGMLNISTYVPFVKPQRSHRIFDNNTPINGLKNPLISSINNPSKTSNKQISESLTTKIINQNIRIQPETKINHEFMNGLIPDSMNNRYVKISHKLQVSLRVSRKITPTNEKDSSKPIVPKVHHYEVMIDTPIYLLNSLCIPDNVELPTYDQRTPTHIVDNFANMDIEDDEDEKDHLPTFEEAMSPMNSPTLGPINTGLSSMGEETISVLSRTPSISVQSQNPEFDNIDDLMENQDLILNQLNERRGSTTKNDILNSFRRTFTQVDNNTDPIQDDGDTGHSSGDEILCSAPPNYDEVVSLLSDDEENESTAFSLSEVVENAESVDLTDLIR